MCKTLQYIRLKVRKLNGNISRQYSSIRLATSCGVSFRGSLLASWCATDIRLDFIVEDLRLLNGSVGSSLIFGILGNSSPNAAEDRLLFKGSKVDSLKLEFSDESKLETEDRLLSRFS